MASGRLDIYQFDHRSDLEANFPERRSIARNLGQPGRNVFAAGRLRRPYHD
jgi:hypothetical protein